MFFIVFGATGLLAEQAAKLVDKGGAANMRETMNRAGGMARGAHLFLLTLPGLIVDPIKHGKTPLGIAALTSTSWGLVLLTLFFLMHILESPA